MWQQLRRLLPAQAGGLRFDAQELSGGLGDIGVMVPIVATLIVSNGFNATSVLLVFGITYVFAGLYFGIPLPVQPLKAMAAVAIAQGLGPDVVSAAGLVMAAVLLILAVSGLMRPLSTLFSRPVVRGIQLAVGLLLVQSGMRLAASGSIIRGGEDFFLRLGGDQIPVGVIIAAALLPLIVLGTSRIRIPFMLVLLPLALLAGLIVSPSALQSVNPGPTLATPQLPDGPILLTALIALVLPQLPLTLGNAVVASTDTAHGYFGDRASRVTHKRILVSMSVANSLAAFLGGMPVCHGAGGLTAHYRFGARTGGATVMVGVLLLVLALGLGAGSAEIFALIPLPVLGALLCLVGIQHSLLARDVTALPEVGIVIAIAIIGIASGNLAFGFVIGILADQTLRIGGRMGFRMPSLARQPPRSAASAVGADGQQTAQ